MTSYRKQQLKEWSIAFALATVATLVMFAAHADEVLGVDRKPVHVTRHVRSIDHRADPKPRLWCAWWLRRKLHIPRSAFPAGRYNQARAFAKIGRPAPRGCIDCIAVFRRGKRGGHVGIVKSWDANGNPIILSGNYNGGVGVGPHRASRLIALRYVAPSTQVAGR